MPRKFDEALLEKLKKNSVMTEYEGLPIIVKPIPEGGEPGDMDPRLYRTSRFLPLVSHMIPKPKKDATTLEKIMPLRKMFGEYKGTEVVTEGVNAQRVTVTGADGYLIPVRIYHRENAGKALPVMIYYHGGGFFGGGPDIVEQMCKVLVRDLDCVVLSVDYRLCPEAHYPQPFDDCWYATKWAFEHSDELGADPHKIAVGGDSAGGNLAAAVTLRDREEKLGMVKLQVLLYPCVNLSGKETEFYHGIDRSRYQFSRRHAKVLNTMLNIMFNMLGGDNPHFWDDLYLQGHLPADSIYASPILDDFHELPPTLLLFGEHDMLVFEDFAYALTAQKAGIPLKTVVYRGLGHGFADQIGTMPQAEDVMWEIAEEMREVLKVYSGHKGSQ